MKIYNKLTILLVICSFAFGMNAQQRVNDQRTNETKIADIVMLLPAKDTEMQNRLMQELVRLDNVIPNLATKLVPPGEGDDSQVRAAISGAAFYASQGNNPGDKVKIAGELCKALQMVKSDEIKDFLLIQLQYVAGDESTGAVSPYLENTRLADAAARVLVRSGGDSAGKALLDAGMKMKSSQASGKTNLEQTIISALGDLHYKPAVGYITSAVSSGELKKPALHSLAQIAAPESANLLAQAAAQSGYAYEQTGATEAYLLFLKNSLAQGNKSMVADVSKKLLNQISQPGQYAAKAAALNLYAKAADEKAIPEIVAALDSKDGKYRAAALSVASTIQSPKMTDALLKQVKKADSPLKSEIITYFGATGNKTALPTVLDALKDSNPEVVAAALTAAGKSGGDQAVTRIVEALKNGTQPSVVTAGQNALLSIKSDNLLSEVAGAIPQATSPAKVALLEILASRRAVPQAETIFTQTLSPDAGVRSAACKALSSVATSKDIPQITKLLNNATKKDDVTALQQAFYAAMAGKSQSEQTGIMMDNAQYSNNPGVYGNILAMVGGKEALDLVMNYGFNSGDSSLKDAAVEALANWSDDSATPQLFEIASGNPSGPYFDKALTAYVSKTQASKNTPEQKLILLRNALQIARTPAQKEEIVKQIAETGTFLGLITAGNCLDDPDGNVQQAAVQAVISIALAHPGYYGKTVTKLINKAMQLNKNPDASYQKQALLKHLASLPQDDGFVSMFNGKDLSGWKGLVDDPIKRAKMTPAQLAEKQKTADDIMHRDWKVENGLLVFEGSGYDNLCSDKKYGDFELYVDWKIAPEGDAGIYLRGSPQVQIWDNARTDVGAQVGSGGLYNNQKYESKPLLVADNPVNEWNSFYIRMEGDKVTVYLNGKLVTDHTVLENYWDRSIPIFPEDAIELQAHGTRVEYRDIYVREIPRPQAYQVSDTEKKDGFVPMFNGVDMTGWTGNLNDYFAKDGMIVCDPAKGGHGNLYTEKEYSNFVMRFEFLLTPAANNGLGIRTPLDGDAAYVGMELQILDNEADVYKDLHEYQYHGSVYGVIPAKRGYLKPVGEWNYQEVIAKGNHITITLNGTVILDGDIAQASKNFTATADGNKHPGLSNKQGHIGFLGHGSWVAFKNLRIKELK